MVYLTWEGLDAFQELTGMSFGNNSLLICLYHMLLLVICLISNIIPYN